MRFSHFLHLDLADLAYSIEKFSILHSRLFSFSLFESDYEQAPAFEEEEEEEVSKPSFYFIFC